MEVITDGKTEKTTHTASTEGLVELADWFRDYAQRKGVSMSQMIKASLEVLQRQDGQVPQQAQREGRT